MDISAVRDSFPLTKAAELCGKALQAGEHRQPCPFCGHTTAFKTTRNKYYICYRCKCKGDVFNFLQDCGKASSFKEALWLIGKQTYTSTAYLQQQRRSTGMERVFAIYQEEAKKHRDIVLQYITERGWPSTLLDKLGYAGSPDILRKAGISETELDELQLLHRNPSGVVEYYSSHIIFPVKNYGNAVVHLSGRSTNPNAELRWKHTKGTPAINNYLYNAAALAKQETAFLTEGISDCESLNALGVAAVGVFGVNIPFVHNAHYFKDLKQLICIFDRDKYPKGDPKEGTYKSWSCVLPHIINLTIELKISVYCLMVPNWSGVKDVNEYLLAIEYDLEEFKAHGKQNVISVQRFAYNMYKDDLGMHQYLWSLLNAVPEPEVEKLFTEHIIATYKQWPAYLKELYGC